MKIIERKVMKCPICGKEIDDAANYCLGCGKKIPRCPTCNKVVSKSESFCIYDGTRIPNEVLSVFAENEEPQPSPAVNTQTVNQQAANTAYNPVNQNVAKSKPKKKTPVWLFIVIIVGGLLFTSLAFFVVANAVLPNLLGNDTKKYAKSADDDDEKETKSKKSKKKSKKSETQEAEEADETEAENDEVMASLDPAAGQSIDNQVPSYETPQASNMVPATLPPQTLPPQTPPPATITYYDSWDMLDYFINNSDVIYFSESDIAGFDANDCRLARNGIYAKMGRKFKDAGLTNFFSQYYWYNPVIEPDNFSDTWLNACQISNRDLIVSYEKRHGFN